MSIILTIRASTTDDEIESAIPYLDMRGHATERRDEAQGEQSVLVYHEIGGVHVLWSPYFGYAYINAPSPGVGNSTIVEAAATADDAAAAWGGIQ